MQTIDKLAWLCIEDGKLLGARSRGKEKFYLPGGKRESGESDQEALAREVKEELSVDLIPDTMEYVDSFRAQADGKIEGTFVNLACYRAEYLGELKASAEIEEIRWLSSRERDAWSQAAQRVLDALVSNGTLK